MQLANPSAPPFIELTEGSKSFGRYKALHNVSVRFEKGISFIVGPNGSGKSTLLKLLSKTLQPDKGKVTWNNVGAPIGYAHELGLYGALTVFENLSFFASLHPNRVALSEALTYWGLNDLLQKNLWQLSKGERVRVSLARAFLGCPSAVLLDEPSSYLDKEWKQVFLNKIKAISSEIPVIVATHDEELLEASSKRIILQAGKVVG